MPKTAKNLWDRFLSWDNFIQAAQAASRHKRCHGEVASFNARLEENVLDIMERLDAGQWRPGPFRELVVYEPKRRIVHAPCFADRVVHHALVQVIGGYFERRFVFDSYACREGKGTHSASQRLLAMLRQARSAFETTYVLKADISQYFNSIDHDILLEILGRIIGDRKTFALIENLVRLNDCIPANRGLPLGSLTSQLFANAYLDQLDHYFKDELRVRFYLRYMDDFIVLHGGKSELWRLYALARDFLAWRLRLGLNRKTKIFPASQGVDFVGYRHWTSHVLPRKRNVKRARKQFKALMRLYAAGKIGLDYTRPRVASFCGYMKHCDCYITIENMLEWFVLRKL